MPIPNEEIGQFKPGESGNPEGRPRKIYTILKKSGYSKDDAREAFHEMAWSSLEDLKKLFEDPNAPVIIKVIAAAYKEAIKKGDYRFVKEIIEQTIGKPKQDIDVTSDGKAITEIVRTVITKPVEG